MKGIVGFGFFLLFLAGIAFVTLQGRHMTQKRTPAASLSGLQWRPIAVLADSIPDTSGMFVKFGDDGSITGHGGCNGFFGSFETTESGISIGPLGATRMACPEPKMQRESAFFDAMHKTTSYDRGDGQMKFLDSDGNVLAEFTLDTQ